MLLSTASGSFDPTLTNTMNSEPQHCVCTLQRVSGKHLLYYNILQYTFFTISSIIINGLWIKKNCAINIVADDHCAEAVQPCQRFSGCPADEGVTKMTLCGCAATWLCVSFHTSVIITWLSWSHVFWFYIMQERRRDCWMKRWISDVVERFITAGEMCELIWVFWGFFTNMNHLNAISCWKT